MNCSWLLRTLEWPGGSDLFTSSVTDGSQSLDYAEGAGAGNRTVPRDSVPALGELPF